MLALIAPSASYGRASAHKHTLALKRVLRIVDLLCGRCLRRPACIILAAYPLRYSSGRLACYAPPGVAGGFACAFAPIANCFPTNQCWPTPRAFFASWARVRTAESMCFPYCHLLPHFDDGSLTVVIRGEGSCAARDARSPTRTGHNDPSAGLIGGAGKFDESNAAPAYVADSLARAPQRRLARIPATGQRCLRSRGSCGGQMVEPMRPPFQQALAARRLVQCCRFSTGRAVCHVHHMPTDRHGG